VGMKELVDAVEALRYSNVAVLGNMAQIDQNQHVFREQIRDEMKREIQSVTDEIRAATRTVTSILQVFCGV
jgi:hypothetical protein